MILNKALINVSHMYLSLYLKAGRGKIKLVSTLHEAMCIEFNETSLTGLQEWIIIGGDLECTTYAKLCL